MVSVQVGTGDQRHSTIFVSRCVLPRKSANDEFVIEILDEVPPSTGEQGGGTRLSHGNSGGLPNAQQVVFAMKPGTFFISGFHQNVSNAV